MKNIKLLAIDIAKNVFQLHGVDKSGKAVFKKQLKRSDLLEFIAPSKDIRGLHRLAWSLSLPLPFATHKHCA